MEPRGETQTRREKHKEAAYLSKNRIHNGNPRKKEEGKEANAFSNLSRATTRSSISCIAILVRPNIVRRGVILLLGPSLANLATHFCSSPISHRHTRGYRNLPLSVPTSLNTTSAYMDFRNHQ
ncbi:hypothetical protein IF1G_05249 [Cordyceps javanica]|uniref:Uncharacterized protein n=1 Tax=Cordyceps javanica TaxID=43265 RepID=A0A545V4Q1_9HYPO|nr:hypothetical protein IF1G_05249 [Cordyceps javanica]